MNKDYMKIKSNFSINEENVNTGDEYTLELKKELKSC